MRTKKIGVLALQGSVEEHLHTLSQIEAAEGFPIRTKEELSRAEAIILPAAKAQLCASFCGNLIWRILCAAALQAGCPYGEPVPG